MSALPSEFQLRRAAQIEAQNIAHLSHENGYRQGYAVGVHDTLPRIQQALGIGVVIGTGFGVVLAVVAAGWL